MSDPEDGIREKPRADLGIGAEHSADTEAVPALSAGRWPRLRRLLAKAAEFGRVEVRGITPIPLKERTVDRTVNVFTLWWSMNANILP